MSQTRSRRNILISVAVLVMVSSILALFLTWSPGRELLDGSHDRRSNGLWMQHGWLGDDAWFRRYKKDVSRFRDIEILNETARQLRDYHITDIYPHLCPCSTSGAIAKADNQQVERFLDAFTGFRVMPWVGGVKGSSAIIDDRQWRKAFVQSCSDLLEEHPRLAGVHINIEPMPSGNQDYLSLLDELRTAIPPGKLISVAAYPPPTFWQPVAAVHWDEDYSREVAKRTDQAVVMMYDTSLRVQALYQQLMKDWTRQVLTWYEPKEVLLGVPAYEDAEASYHDPRTENLTNALMGIHAGLDEPPPVCYRGVGIYCEWEMTPAKWQQFRRHFCAPGDDREH